MKIPYFVPWITTEDKKSVLKALEQRWLTNGPILDKFEKKISRFVKTKHAVGVSSATHALHLCLRSLRIGPEDDVIVPTMTFSATAEVVKYCGANLVLADVDPNTFNITPDEIKKRITKKTKAVIPVHYGGQACDMDEILSIARKNNLEVIEDCAHALGSTYRKKMCGSFGIAGCFSFYPTKIITTGEGGMITTNDHSLFEKSCLLRSHGVSITPNERELEHKWAYDITDLGYNYRMDEIRASLGLSQFKRIKKINLLRNDIANFYNTHLKNIEGIEIPLVKNDRNHIYHLYTIKINSKYHLTRDQLIEKLFKKGIGISVQYLPLHFMTYYRKSLKKKDQFPNADIIKNQIICLPIFPTLTKKQLEFIVSALK